MDVVKAVKHLFPNANENEDFVILNNGEGDFIAEWHIDSQQPTQEQLNIAWDQYQSNPPQVPLSELERLKKQQELMQQAIDDLIFGGAL